MRRAVSVVFGALLFVVAVGGCSTAVSGTASTSETPTRPPVGTEPLPPLAEGAQPSCLAEDGCGPGDPTTPAGVVCSPLPTAMSAFDARARAAFAGGEVTPHGSSASMSALSDAVIDVVNACGFRVMVDVANQYPDPLYSWLLSTSVMALGEVGSLPGGMRCADLAGMGLSPKNAVDYWFLWGSPDLMDADLDGTPCETVWADVGRYMPSYY